MFQKKFDSYVCDGDSIRCTIDGIEYVATVERDHDGHIDNDDCHNPDQDVTGCNDEQQERLLEARIAWSRDGWWYVGVVISASKDGIEISDHLASLWGIECNYPGSDNEYLSVVANELLSEAIPAARKRIAEMVAKLTA